MRKFKEVIFLGAPNSDFARKLLHERLDEALDILGGLQQPDHSESKEHAKQCDIDRAWWEFELSEAIMDLRVVLGDKTSQ